MNAADLAEKQFPGEAVEVAGHALTTLPEGEERERRVESVLPGDKMLDWYLFRAATRRERRAEEVLIEAGFAVYLPRGIRWQRLGPKKERVSFSLFGGYLFVGLSSEQSFYALDHLEAIHAPVRFGAERTPQALKFSMIRQILRQEVDGEFDKTRRDRRRDPAAGTLVRVKGGMFQGWPARFVERREDDRIILLLEMFGRATRYAVDEVEVELPLAEGERK